MADGRAMARPAGVVRSGIRRTKLPRRAGMRRPGTRKTRSHSPGAGEPVNGSLRRAEDGPALGGREIETLKANRFADILEQQVAIAQQVFRAGAIQ